MNIIMGYNDLLRDDTFGPLNEEQKRVLMAMDRSAAQLLELINATLDLSRLEAGRLPLLIDEVDMGLLLSAIRDETTHLEKPEVALRWAIPADLGCLRTDPVKVKVILKNLVQNGIKFTDSGEVQVEARRVQDAVELSVSDTGVGIAAEALPAIFEPFRQLEEASTRVHGGVGLGLYLVRRMTDLLGGRITVESQVGRGSTFRLWLANADDSSQGN
jgi:signal transduction histidine kinase